MRKTAKSKMNPHVWDDYDKYAKYAHEITRAYSREHGAAGSGHYLTIEWPLLNNLAEGYDRLRAMNVALHKLIDAAVDVERCDT